MRIAEKHIGDRLIVKLGLLVIPEAREELAFEHSHLVVVRRVTSKSFKRRFEIQHS